MWFCSASLAGAVYSACSCMHGWAVPLPAAVRWPMKGRGHSLMETCLQKCWWQNFPFPLSERERDRLSICRRLIILTGKMKGSCWSMLMFFRNSDWAGLLKRNVREFGQDIPGPLGLKESSCQKHSHTRAKILFFTYPASAAVASVRSLHPKNP